MTTSTANAAADTQDSKLLHDPAQAARMAQLIRDGLAPENSPTRNIADAPSDDIEQALMSDIHAGLDKLRKMSQDELKALIRRRVALLDNTLVEREERREVLHAARLASRLMDIRRDNSRRMKRRVSMFSYASAVSGTVVLFVAVF